jgi:hypothetical protein
MNTTYQQHDRDCHLTTRRSFLGDMGTGLAGVALSSMLARDSQGAEKGWHPPDGQPHFKPKAKSVIWLFMRGGLSHMESFDNKPALTKYAGKSIQETPFSDVQNPERLKKARKTVVNDANGQQRNKIFPLQIGFKKYGQSGIEVSDWFQNIGRVIDDVAVIRSMWTSDDIRDVTCSTGDFRASVLGLIMAWGRSMRICRSSLLWGRGLKLMTSENIWGQLTMRCP